MAEETQKTVSEMITSTIEEKKPETETKSTEPQKEEKKEPTKKIEATQENKDIIAKKIEETFNNLDKYETILNDFHKKIWDEVKFPMENIIEESKLNFYYYYIIIKYSGKIKQIM